MSVKEADRVKLIDGFLGNCSPCLPQYLTIAILLGLLQVIAPEVKAEEESSSKRGFSYILNFIFLNSRKGKAKL
jgi:hypothetical protein